MKTILRFAGALLMIGFGGGDVSSANDRAIPAFELRSIENKTYTDRHLTGQPALLMFWASWCHVCQGELPKVQALQERMKGRPFHILTIGFADSEANIRNYVASHPAHFTFPVLYDAGSTVASRFNVRNTPTVFLLNAKGEVVLRHQGGGLFDHPDFDATVAHLGSDVP